MTSLSLLILLSSSSLSESERDKKKEKDKTSWVGRADLGIGPNREKTERALLCLFLLY